MMRAIVQRAYGATDVLKLHDITEPSPGPHDVLIAVHAASVNRADWLVTTGRPSILRVVLGLRRPRVPVRGRDLAGTVVTVGGAVTGFSPGDEVYAETTTGSFAEYACVPERLLAPKPTNLTFEQAAAVPLAAVTALQGLRDVGQVQPGQAVLINGASGGVGTFAVQIAKTLGADVTGVCSTRNVELVRSLGADRVIDYTREDFTRSGPRYDVILDLAGRHPLTACRGALTRRGTLVLASGHGGPVLGPLGRYARALAWSPFVTQRLRVHASKPSRSDLDALTALIEAGAVTPVIEATYELADTPAAIRHLSEAHARAKNVIAVRGSHAAPQPSTKETNMHDLDTKQADRTEEQNDSALRWGGRAGILGSLLMLVTFGVVAAFVGMDITPEQSLTRFPDIKVARTVENTLYLAALLSWVVHSLGLYRALRRRSPGPALFGAVLSILGLAMMVAGALPHVATAPLSDLYHAAGATPQDQATLLLVWHGIYAMLVDTLLVTGLLIVPLGLIAFGRAMFEAPDFGARLGSVTVGLGLTGLAAASTLLVQNSMIAAVGVFALIGFHLIAGWRTYSLAKSAAAPADRGR